MWILGNVSLFFFLNKNENLLKFKVTIPFLFLNNFDLY